MKKVLFPILALVLALGLGLVPGASVGANPGPGIVGLWHLDEGTGKTAYDSSGLDNDGTLSGGRFGGALSFDGANDYVDCGASVDNSIATGITLEAWIKPAVKQNGGIISNDLTYNTKKGYDFFLWAVHDPYGRLYIDFGNGSTLGRTWWAIPNSDWYNQWHHVAATWNGSVIKLYVDGSQVATVSYTGTYSDPGKATLIGGINYGTLPYCSFDGIIDEVRISNVARIPPFDLTSPPSVDGNTVGLWHLDAGSGQTATDAAGTNHGQLGSTSGTDANDPTWIPAGPTWTTGKFGNALSFDGADDYVNIPDDDSLDITTAITLEAWIKPASLPDTTGFKGPIVAKWKIGDNQRSYYLGCSSNNIHFALSPDGTWENRKEVISTATISVNTWYHIAGVWDGSTMKIFINGVEDANTFAFSGAIHSGTGPVRVGSIVDGIYESYVSYFDGIIDEVRIWDTAYPDLEVSAAPTEDYNQVTFGHEITATVDPVLPDGATVGLEVTAGPNTGTIDSGETDASGEVTLSYTDTGSSTTGSTELDTIRIWVDRNWNDSYDSDVDFATTVTKNWVKLVSLTPPESFNPVCHDHTVEATISSEVSGIKVWFEVTGANPSGSSPDFSDTTDSNGVASFTYHGANPGTDTIRAYFDTNGNDDYDTDEPSLTVTKYWLEHYVTGGGIITEGKGKNAAKITFGGNVGFDLAGNEVGQWQCNFHNVNKADLDKGQFHSTSILSLTFQDITVYPDPDPPPADYNKAIFEAMGRFNGKDGWKIEVRLTDFGEPGRDGDPDTHTDSIRILLWNPSNNLKYDSLDDAGGDFPDEDVGQGRRTELDGGNIQIHPPDLP